MATNIERKEMKQVCEELETSLDVIVSNIVQISEGMKKLASSRLKPDILYVLVSRASGVNVGEVKKVMEALPHLEEKFCKKVQKS